MHRMHPLLITLCIFVVLGLVQRLFPPSRGRIGKDATPGPGGIGVVLVAPAGAEVEPKLRTLLSLSADPKLVKLYVAKMCEAGEVPAEPSNFDVRAASRMHYVRARRNTQQSLRAALVQKVLEPHTLCIPWYHEAEWGWDDLLHREWTACADRDGVLSTRITNRAGEPGYITLSSFDGTNVSFGVASFASQPPGPEPSIACSAQLLFAPTHLLQRGWPTKKEVDGAHEDFALTAFLWMNGARFYAPHNQPLFFETGREERDTPGPTRFPTTAGGGTPRTREELWTSLGVRRGKLSSRARSGVTLRASMNERFHKTGHHISIQREL